MLTLAAGCSPRQSVNRLTVPGTPTPIAAFTGLRLFEQSGVRWEGTPQEVLTEQMTFEQAKARLGWQLPEADTTPAETLVWVVVMKGRYRIFPVDPSAPILGPYEECIATIFTSADGRWFGVGDVNCALSTPTPTTTPSPVPSATATLTPSPLPSPTQVTEYWESQAPDFGFRFEAWSCIDSVLDTSLGTFTTDIDYDPPTKFTVPLRLSDSQLRSIYRRMVDIDFFNYPGNFAVPTIPGHTGYVTPAEHYLIVVRNNGVEKSLYWYDEIFEPTTREADELRSLFDMIWQMIESNPAYQQIPERDYGCA